MAPQVVWLTRHGNRQDFVDAEWRATALRPFDPGLSDDGHTQARHVGRRLRGEGIIHLFASPYLRTVQTAHHIAEALDRRIYLEPGLGEWLNADWFDGVPERQSPAALAAAFPRIDLAHQPLLEPRYPETEAEALARTGEVARRLTETYPGTMLLVGHGASVTGAVRGFAGAQAAFETPLCGLFKLVRPAPTATWSMELCGDVAHLDRRPGAGTRWH